MIDEIFFGAAAAYGLAGVLLIAYLVGAGKRPPAAGVAVLSLAALLHLVHDLARWALLHVSPFAGVAPSLSTLGLCSVIAFLFVRRWFPRVDVVGAFITPVALLLLLASRVHAHESGARGALLVLHIASNTISIAAFTVAFGMAVAYLIQERQVKARHLGGLFHRLPPLEVLDRLAFRCIAVGMPALTLGVITGHIVSARGMRAQGLPWQQYFAMIAWGLFAAVLLLRTLAGWRGRRAAIGTILGYASVLLVLLFYTVRAGPA